MKYIVIRKKDGRWIPSAWTDTKGGTALPVKREIAERCLKSARANYPTIEYRLHPAKKVMRIEKVI
jgi:HEPN domain-containing protein